MKKFYYVLLLVLVTPLFIHAQEIVLTPQVGIQNSQSKTSFNSSPYYSPGHNDLTVLGFRLNYQSKKGHGPFVGFGWGTRSTTYNILDGGVYSGSYTTGYSDLLRVQVGYQWNTKPIYFKRLWDNHTSYDDFSKQQRKGWSVRLQPYVGLGMDFRKAALTHEVIQTTNGSISTYSNRSNPTITGGLNFEFAKNGRKIFTLGMGYTRSFGSPHNSVYEQTYGGTTYQTQFYQPNGAFNITLGIPLTLWKKWK